MAEPYTLAASGPDEYRCFVLPIQVPAGKYIRSIEYRPGNRKVVHHAVITSLPRPMAAAKLAEAEIKTLVVDDKWLARLSAVVQDELERTSQTLTGRIRELAERYATPLPLLNDEVAMLAARVDGHLAKMGAEWK